MLGFGEEAEGVAVAAVVLEVVVAAVVAPVVVAALVVLAVVVDVEDEECPPIIRSSLWHPPKVNINAAAQARTEKRIVTPIGSVGAPTQQARNAHADASVSWRVSLANLTKFPG